jgi:glutamyl-tRNA synthetase
VLRAERELAVRALDIERVDTPKPRKDLRKWAGFRPVCGFFFREIFQLVTDASDERFGGLDPDLVRAVASGFAAGYRPPAPDVDWFDQVRELAVRLGFAVSQKEYKQDPDAYPGSIREASAIVRVLITGSRQSPSLPDVVTALGQEEVLRRVTALT